MGFSRVGFRRRGLEKGFRRVGLGRGGFGGGVY